MSNSQPSLSPSSTPIYMLSSAWVSLLTSQNNPSKRNSGSPLVHPLPLSDSHRQPILHWLEPLPTRQTIHRMGPNSTPLCNEIQSHGSIGPLAHETHPLYGILDPRPLEKTQREQTRPQLCKPKPSKSPTSPTRHFVLVHPAQQSPPPRPSSVFCLPRDPLAPTIYTAPCLAHTQQTPHRV